MNLKRYNLIKQAKEESKKRPVEYSVTKAIPGTIGGAIGGTIVPPLLVARDLYKKPVYPYAPTLTRREALGRTFSNLPGGVKGKMIRGGLAGIAGGALSGFYLGKEAEVTYDTKRGLIGAGVGGAALVATYPHAINKNVNRLIIENKTGEKLYKGLRGLKDLYKGSPGRTAAAMGVLIGVGGLLGSAAGLGFKKKAEGSLDQNPSFYERVWLKKQKDDFRNSLISGGVGGATVGLGSAFLPGKPFTKGRFIASTLGGGALGSLTGYGIHKLKSSS